MAWLPLTRQTLEQKDVRLRRENACVRVCLADEFSFLHLDFKKTVDHPGEESQYTVVEADVELRRDIWLRNLEFVVTVFVVTET